MPTIPQLPTTVQVVSQADTIVMSQVVASGPNAGQSVTVQATVANVSAGVNAGAVQKVGDTMTGVLTLFADPVNALDASTKQYADTHGTGKIILTQPATGATLTITDTKSLTVLKTITLTGTDGTTHTFPPTSQTIPGTGTANVFTQANSFASTTATRFNSNATGSQLQIGTGTSLDGLANNWIWGQMRITGTITGADAIADSQGGANKLVVTDQGTIGSPTYAGFLVNMYSGAANIVDPANAATRQGIHSRIVAQGQNGATPTIGPAVSNMAFISSLSTGYATHTQGGLGGWSDGLNPSLGYYRGSMFGGNDNVWLTTGAANYFYLIGREIDVSIQGTSSVYGRYGLLINSFASTKQADSTEDAGIAIVSQDNTANNFKNGITFGAATSFGSVSDSLIRTRARTQPSGSAASVTAPRGIDFSDAVFSDAFLRGPSNSFVVDGVGNTTVAGKLTAGLPPQLPVLTVATLPTASANAGCIAYVTDATSPTYNATLVGGGAVKCLAMSNGTNWTAH